MANPRTFIGGTVTDVAPVAALPTTAAHLAIQNGSTSGKVYLITSIGLTTTTSAAAVAVIQALANNSTGPQASITGTLAAGPKSLDGLFPGSTAQVYSAVTIVNTGIWHPVGMGIISAAMTATIAQGTWTDVSRVGYYVQPGGVFSLAAFCSAAGSAKCSIFVTWQEA